MATDKPRYSITVDDDLFDAIEDFRFQYRFQTRNDATVALIRMGLEKISENTHEEVNEKVRSFKNPRKPKHVIIDANAAAHGGGLLNAPSPPVDEHHKKVADELEFEGD